MGIKNGVQVEKLFDEGDEKDLFNQDNNYVDINRMSRVSLAMPQTGNASLFLSSTPYKQLGRPGSGRQLSPKSESSVDENLGDSAKIVKRKAYNKSRLREKRNMGQIEQD